jgi:hypothetical protein
VRIVRRVTRRAGDQRARQPRTLRDVKGDGDELMLVS